MLFNESKNCEKSNGNNEKLFPALQNILETSKTMCIQSNYIFIGH